MAGMLCVTLPLGVPRRSVRDAVRGWVRRCACTCASRVQVSGLPLDRPRCGGGEVVPDEHDGG
jgi:hypothetical protein